MFDHLYAYNFLNLKMLTFCTSMQIEDKSCSADANGKSVIESDKIGQHTLNCTVKI